MQEDTCEVEKALSFIFQSFVSLFFHNMRHKVNFDVFLCRANCPIEDPVMAPGALIDVAKYVGSLAFDVWEKMLAIIKYSEHIL